jgi:signal recognition particle GTPase
MKHSNVRVSPATNDSKLLNSGYMAKQFLILLPESLENTKTNRKAWAEKIMNAAKSVGIWRFAPVFEYAGDESNSKEENVVDNLDMHLLNADIAGFLGRYVFDDINDIINDNDFKNQIYAEESNKQSCADTLSVFWNCWM